MVEFLDTPGVSYQLAQIIKTAGERLVLISPYLKISKRIRDLLEDQDRLKRDIRIVYRHRELQPEETEWLGSTSIRTSYCESLHAKCYMNEQTALITSMNLYEFSQQNNDEMGILVSAQDDPIVYRAIKDEADRIIRTAEDIRVTVAKVAPSEAVNLIPSQAGGVAAPVARGPASQTSRATQTTVTTIPQAGFCIRCASEIAVNPSQPYCRRCFASWKRYENKAYEEKHCHACGGQSNSTLLKPLCRACYGKFKDVLELAAN